MNGRVHAAWTLILGNKKSIVRAQPQTCGKYFPNVFDHKYEILSGNTGKYKIQTNTLTMYLITFENTFQKNITSLHLQKQQNFAW